jgi:hypothetical protein
MADEADRSDERIQQMIDDGIARARRQVERSLPSIGVCHNCESEVGSGRIFCSKECSDDYDAITAARKRNGQ